MRLIIFQRKEFMTRWCKKLLHKNSLYKRIIFFMFLKIQNNNPFKSIFNDIETSQISNCNIVKAYAAHHALNPHPENCAVARSSNAFEKMCYIPRPRPHIHALNFNLGHCALLPARHSDACEGLRCTPRPQSSSWKLCSAHSCSRGPAMAVVLMSHAAWFPHLSQFFYYIHFSFWLSSPWHALIFIISLFAPTHQRVVQGILFETQQGSDWIFPCNHSEQHTPEMNVSKI